VSEPAGDGPERIERLFREMARIRAFETVVRREHLAGRIPGLVHLYSGQEAVAVGVCDALEDGDWIASHHRGHGHCLARGADPFRLMAELMGRAAGYGGGRGGALHIYDPEHFNLGTNGIVGGGVPLALGAALTARVQQRDRVSVAFFGDGALNQGLVFECLNMAALWRLAILFVCENNRYGEFTAIEDAAAGADLKDRARVFGIPAMDVDGMDVVAVSGAAQEAVARARAGDGPTFLLCETYRFSGHHVSDRQDYKDAEEARTWAERDPLRRHRDTRNATRFDEIQRAAEAEMRQAAEQAAAAPFPDPAHLGEAVNAA